MFGKVKIEYRGLLADVRRGDMREARLAQKSAWGTTGNHWHRRMRPKHFTPAGAREYGYSIRTDRYKRRKMRRFGHTDPLVWTGQSRAISALRDVRTTSKGARVRISGTKFKLARLGARLNLAKEMSTVSAAEEKQLEAVFRNRLERNIKNIRGRRVVRI